MSSIKFKYIDNLSKLYGPFKYFPNVATNEITVVYKDKYFATISDKIRILNIENDFANIYLYAVITIQLILSKISKPEILLSNFIKYAESFNLIDLAINFVNADCCKCMKNTWGLITNGLFNVKWGTGDCELNTAFAVYLDRYEHFNIVDEFMKLNLNKIETLASMGSSNLEALRPMMIESSDLKTQMNEYDKIKFAMEFKIKEYILFMKFIIGCRRYNEHHDLKTHFDFNGLLLPRVNVLPNVEFDCSDTISPVHALLIQYDRKNMIYSIYDIDNEMSRQDIKLGGQKLSNEINISRANARLNTESVAYMNVEYIDDYTYVGVINNHYFKYSSMDGNGNIYDLTEKSYVEIGKINFNQFKYILLNYFITCQTRLKKNEALTYTAWQLLGASLREVHTVDYDLLDKYIKEVENIYEYRSIGFGI